MKSRSYRVSIYSEQNVKIAETGCQDSQKGVFISSFYLNHRRTSMCLGIYVVFVLKYHKFTFLSYLHLNLRLFLLSASATSAITATMAVSIFPKILIIQDFWFMMICYVIGVVVSHALFSSNRYVSKIDRFH